MNALEYRHVEGFQPQLFPELSVGKDAQKVVKDLFKGVRSASPSVRLPSSSVVRKDARLDERLYESRASFKVFASTVSMHLGRDWLQKLFAQVDSALDVEEWDPRDPPPAIGTARTFVRMLLILKSHRKPGLGISNSGNFIAAWTNGGNRLTIECLADDRVRWVLARLRDGDVERAAGESKIDRLGDVLAPYRPDIWFEHAK